MNYLPQIDLKKAPKHVAIIMDGNGRWAKQQGMNRIFGHRNALTSIRESVEAASDIGTTAITLYAFSTENWKRPKLEVDALMNLLISSLKKELPGFQKNNIQIRAIGALENLPKKAQKTLFDVIDATKTNKKLTLTFALSYGSREEIINAVQKISKKIVNKTLSVEDIDENVINNHLYTVSLPEVDLVIRTSGEQRISNFLLWQIAYAEFYFTDILWPDFRKNDFYKAVVKYQNRERRFGKTSEQIKKLNES